MRTRNFSFLMYDTPGSSIYNDLNRMFKHVHDTLHCKVAFCIHDRDVLDDGSPKKAHAHVVIAYEGVKSLEQVKEDVAGYASNDYVEPVRNLSGALRYLSHADNPDKYQYTNVHNFGFSQRQFEKREKTDDMAQFWTIIDWVNDNQCYSLAALVDWARDNQPEWVSTLLKPAFCQLILKYMQSAQYALRG